ncbi:branched-chain amino acid transporter permease [Anaerovorax odorimutans]|nr:AzlD domain-containing protein [Anaerovorax odorimutans]
MSTVQVIIMILALAAGVMVTRFVPFVLFPENRQVPKTVEYLGSVLPPAVIALLVVYCLRNVDFLHGSFGLPEILSILAICGLHTWKRNSLLSIAGGTILYMILLHFIG